MKNLAPTRILLLLFSSLLALIGATEAHADLQADFDVKSLMRTGLMQNPKYMGMKSAWIDDGVGTFCQKEHNWWFAWQAELEEAQIDLNQDNSEIKVGLLFRNSWLEASGFSTGGILCAPMGGSGRATVDDFKVQFTINKQIGQNSGGKSLIHVEQLAIKGLKIDRVDISVPFFSVLNGSAPDWLNDFVERNINGLTAAALNSSLSRRIDAKLSDVVAKWISEFGDGGSANSRNILESLR